MDEVVPAIISDKKNESQFLVIRSFQAEDLERYGVVEFCDKDHGWDMIADLLSYLGEKCNSPKVYHPKEGVDWKKIAATLERN